MAWFLYLIECEDDSIYTGITTDVAARFAQHLRGGGARYTRTRKPRALLASFPLADRSSASRAEYWVKRLTATQKRDLASGRRPLESVLPAAALAPEPAKPGRPTANPAATESVSDDASADTPTPSATRDAPRTKPLPSAKRAGSRRARA